jgi:hypothetical protein
MKQVLLCILLCSAAAAYGQLPPQEKVLMEIQRISNSGQNVFQSWKGAIASNLGQPEYESLYTFPGTKEARIKQLSKAGRQLVYYYEALIAEDKTDAEIRKVLKNWEQILGDSVAAKVLRPERTSGASDERNIATPTYTILEANKNGEGILRIHLDYEQDDEGLYIAYIQIGNLY